MGSVGIAFPVLSQVRHPKGGYALVNSFDNKQTCVVAMAGETTELSLIDVCSLEMT